MIRSTIRLAAVLLACAGICAFSAAPVAAQDAAPALRASVTVTGDTVRIGDLVENAGVVADVPVFRAPDLGTRGAVATERVVDAIRPHQLIGIDTRGLSEVIVTRASRAIAPQEISARIAQALAGQYGFGDAHNIQVAFDREVRTLQVEANATGELQVLGLSYDPRTTRFEASLDLPSSTAIRQQSARFTGTAIETVDAITVTRPVEHGEVLSASDLTVARRPKAEGPAITDIKAAAGHAARHALRPGQPLHDADLMKPILVQRNDTVTIVYEAPGITLTLRGQAQEAGGLGDTVSVANVQSKRVIQGIVTGPGRVTISAGPTHVVESASQPAADVPAPSAGEPQQEHRVSSTE